MAKRLAVLALKGAKNSNSDDLVNDATLLMSELGQPILDTLSTVREMSGVSFQLAIR